MTSYPKKRLIIGLYEIEHEPPKDLKRNEFWIHDEAKDYRWIIETRLEWKLHNCDDCAHIKDCPIYQRFHYQYGLVCGRWRLREPIEESK